LEKNKYLPLVPVNQKEKLDHEINSIQNSTNMITNYGNQHLKRKYARPLHNCIKRKNISMFKKIIIENKFPINDTLTLENEIEDTLISICVKENLFEFVKFLLEYGCEVDPCDKNDNWTPLMQSIQRGNLLITELLLKYGANVNKKDVDGFSVLTIAVDTRNVKMCKMVLSYHPLIDNPKEILEILEANKDRSLFKILKEFYFAQRKPKYNIRLSA